MPPTYLVTGIPAESSSKVTVIPDVALLPWHVPQLADAPWLPDLLPPGPLESLDRVT